MRINKYLASCGLGSRRKVEELIKEGRVCVDGKVETNLSTDITDKNEVTVDGNVCAPNSEFVYLLLHKPKGYISSVSDDRGRKTVMDLIPKELRFVKPVGRLDYDSEGLLILTNDGDLAFNLTHPSKQIGKTYLVKIEGNITEGQLAVLRNGAVVDGVRLAKCKAKVIENKDNITKLEVTIFEGKNREIRKMFEAVGYLVIFLKRTKIGELTLRGVDRGAYRNLTPSEVAYLKAL
ncbi:MAG: rRNA pseudouridine synthase [Clostridia bacterium]|nr:rRNA pseudouridine synthase [Clostridia bacterium]